MSIFTRRNYVFLASVCRDILHNAKTTRDTNPQLQTGTHMAITDLADALAVESPSFDKQQFFDAIYKDPTIDSLHSKKHQGEIPNF